MPIYILERRTSEGWMHLASGDFPDYQRAEEQSRPMLAELGVEPADFRIVPAAEFPRETQQTCEECGGLVMYDSELKMLRCNQCHAEYEFIPESELEDE